MGKNRKHIDDLFKEGLGGFAPAPPPAVWEALETRLAGAPPAGHGMSAAMSSTHTIIVAAAMVIGVLATKVFTNNLHVGDNLSSPHTTIAPVPGASAPAYSGSYNAASKPTASSPAATPSSYLPTTNNNISPSGRDIYSAKTALASSAAGIAINSVASNLAVTTPLHAKKLSAAAQAHNALQTSALGTNSLSRHKGIAHGAKKNVPVSGKAAPNSLKTNSLATYANEYDPTELIKNNNTAATVNSTPPLGTTLVPGALAEIPIKKEAIKKTLMEQQIKKEEYPQSEQKKWRRYEAGIKAGIENDFTGKGAKKIVVSPYAQYNLSSRFSLMMQPAIKYARISNRNLSGTQSYYKENKDSSATIHAIPIYTPNGDTIGHIDQITYSQTHDNIVKSYSAGGSWLEFELPVLLKYAVVKNISVYGGITMSYSAYINVAQQSYTSNPVLEIATSELIFVKCNSSPPVLPVSSQIGYSGTPVTNYKGPLFDTPPGGVFRLGYMIGFNYQYTPRWMVDALIQKAAAPALVQGGYNINAPLSAPYYRITLGYKITR